MVERNISHEEVEKTINKGIKIDEYERVRSIYETEDGRFITALYVETRKYRIIRTVFKSGRTDIELYRRSK